MMPRSMRRLLQPRRRQASPGAKHWCPSKVHFAEQVTKFDASCISWSKESPPMPPPPPVENDRHKNVDDTPSICAYQFLWHRRRFNAPSVDISHSWDSPIEDFSLFHKNARFLHFEIPLESVAMISPAKAPTSIIGCASSIKETFDIIIICRTSQPRTAPWERRFVDFPSALFTAPQYRHECIHFSPGSIPLRPLAMTCRLPRFQMDTVAPPESRYRLSTN